MATNVGSMNTSVQGSSAHLYVPQSPGPDCSTVDDDARTPAAYLRLGAYSTIESRALPDPNVKGSVDVTQSFYPRQHKTDAGTNVVEHAAGDPGTYKGGIMLACDGRMLMRAGERFYLHSVGAMHVDTESTLTVFAAQAISVTTDSSATIRTNNAQPILITADSKKGDVTIEAKKATRSVAGNDYEYIDTDKYTYTQADTYAYKLGRAESVTLGDSLSFFLGATYSFKVSIEITIALAALILFYLMKFEVGLLKLDFQAWKVEMKEGKVQRSFLNAKAVDLYTTSNGAKIAAATVKKNLTTIQDEVAMMMVQNLAIGLEGGGPKVDNSAISVKS